MKTFAIIGGALVAAAFTSGIVLAAGPVPGVIGGAAIVTAATAVVIRIIARK